MTSMVVGNLQPGISFYGIFRDLFPGGSITGAPKHRTTQIIQELERNPRGVYTGAIGFISPHRSCVFNLAIRTLVTQNGHVTMGVGGGIVADSEAEDEYRECLLKASFVTRPRESFQLIETMFWDGEYKLLQLHLDRMESSALYFDFYFDRWQMALSLGALIKSPTFDARNPHRIRLTLAANGQVTIEVSKAPDEPSKTKIWLTDESTSSNDPFRRHKTTRRESYDRLYATAREHGFEDVIFSNEKGEITEGAVSNVFIGRIQSMSATPSVLT